MAESARQLVITGASGQLGRRVAECVLDADRAQRPILVTRNPNALADLAARGADVRCGDFSNGAGLRDAFAGGERLLLISATDLARRTAQHEAAIQAAVAAGIEHVIYTSMLSPAPPNPAVIAPSHYATERALARSGLAWTVLRHSLYADYQVAEAMAAIRTGSLLHNRGAGRIAYVAREDCAAAAAAVLIAAGHVDAVYEVTGPQAFDAEELAALYGELGECRVAAVAVDDATLIAGIAGGGDDHARYGAELVASLGRAVRDGYMAACTDAVATLTGRAPLTLRQLLEAKLGPAQASQS